MAYPATDVNVITQFVGSLNAVGVTVTPEVGTSVHTVGIARTAGNTVTALTIQLQGSHDGTNWFSLGQSTVTTASVDSITATAVVKFLRLQVTAVTATTPYNIAGTIQSVG